MSEVMEAAALTPSRGRLRIAVFNRAFCTTGGGAERYSIALVEQLAARHEVHVFAQDIDHHWPGVHYHRVSAPLRKPRWINQLWFATATWWATRRGFDVVHSHENTWHGDVQTVHVLPVRYNLFQGRTGGAYAARCLKVATSPRLLAYLGLEWLRYAPRPGKRVVVTSPSLKAIMAPTYPACSDRLAMITPGVTLPAATTAESKRAARVHLGLPQGVPCLLFVANDYRKKGLPSLLAALAQLPVEVVLAVVGNPSQAAQFAALIAELNLANRVFFLGTLKDMAPAYEAADGLVHPTLEDTFAMVVLEAMAHQLPVIVSAARYCGISGLLTAGVNAEILEDPRDVASLTQAMHRVTTQPAWAAALAQSAYAFAQGYRWQELALTQEAMYFALQAEKRTPVD